MNEQSLARGLAAFSLGLGFAELLAPRRVAQLIGISEDHARLLQLMGLREIGSGLGIMQGKPKYFLWSRVAGDALDLSLLGAAMRSPETDRRRASIAMGAVAGVTILDVVASILHSREHTEPGWRIADPGTYRGAISEDDPHALRAATDEAMRSHQSAHVWREEEALAAGQPSLPLPA